MSIIYVPRLIESAEQAEALPEGTIIYAHHDDPELVDVGLKSEEGYLTLGGHGLSYAGKEMIGYTALVPIEADKVRSENRGGFFVTERHAADPFAAYYVHGEEA